MICWSDDCDLAELPCNHLFCKPLFGAHDRLMLITEKGNYVCSATMATKLAMDLSFELMRRRYGWALFHLFMLSFLLSMPIYAFLKLRAAGMTVGQWRDNSQGKARTKNDMRISVAVFSGGVITTGFNLWNDYHRFKRA
jgi:hypothetical protein